MGTTLIQRSARTLRSVDRAIPDAETLEGMAALSRGVEERGHFLPSEEEAVLGDFARYLSARAALHETIDEIQNRILTIDVENEDRLQCFGAGLAAASMLWRWADQLINHLAPGEVVREKLNQGEPRYGIPRKQFTAIYRSFNNPANYFRYAAALRYADRKWDRLLSLSGDEGFDTIREFLGRERTRIVRPASATYLREAWEFVRHSFRRRGRSSLRNVSFALFEVSGRIVSEARNPLYEKKVTVERRAELLALAKPGDVFVTRHHDALTNLFLPGYWPHGFLYLGTEDQRAELGIEFPSHREHRSQDPVRFLEARKDGVLFREPADSLSVDAVAIVRPKVSPERIREAIERAATHEGKGYDFEFDFSRSDRLVCTEVIYRCYEGIDGIHIPLATKAGRVCLPAENLLRMSLEPDGHFKPVAVFGPEGCKGIATGDEAVAILEKTTAAQA